MDKINIYFNELEFTDYYNAIKYTNLIPKLIVDKSSDGSDIVKVASKDSKSVVEININKNLETLKTTTTQQTTTTHTIVHKLNEKIFKNLAVKISDYLTNNLPKDYVVPIGYTVSCIRKYSIR